MYFDEKTFGHELSIYFVLQCLYPVLMYFDEKIFGHELSIYLILQCLYPVLRI